MGDAAKPTLGAPEGGLLPVPLFGRRRKHPPAAPSPVNTSPTSPKPLRVLRADGARIDLTARDVGQRIALTRQDWQADAWAYRDLIGELRYSQRLLARAVARCRFYAASLQEWPQDPVELSGKDHGLGKQLAADAVANLARLPLNDDPDGFLAALTENLANCGEGWIHGQPDREEETWDVRSVSEVQPHGDQVMLAEIPNMTTGLRPIEPDSEELLRCWIRHPRWGQLADSPLRSLLDTCEEIVLTGREIRAAARSRIAANGLILMPESLSLVRTRTEDEELEDQKVSDDGFMADLIEAVTTPIRNEGDPGAVVPIVLRGAAEDLKEVRHLRLDRADSEELMDRLNGAVFRLLRGLDVQPEQVQGVGTLNHWSGWLVEAASVKHQVEPMASTLAGCLTKAFLRPALLALGHDPEQVHKVVVWVDASGLAENPNRGQDARDAHDRLVISDDALRQALGFDDSDEPNEEEVNRRIAAKVGMEPATNAVVLGLLSELKKSKDAEPKPPPAGPGGGAGQLPPGGGNGARPAGQGQTVPEQTTPQEPQQVVAAVEAAQPIGWRVDVDTARQLGALDAELADRIVVAADEAINRAVERAGGRARNAIRKDRELAASVEGVDTHLVAAAVGADRLASFVAVSDLLSGATDRLRQRMDTWLREAARAAADLTLRLLGLDRSSPVGSSVWESVFDRFSPHRQPALDALQQAVDKAAAEALFRDDPMAPPPKRKGEDAGTLISPGEVVRALTTAGGGQPHTAGDSGLGTGPVVRDALAEFDGVLLGWEWNYRVHLPRDTFEPHLALDGTRFPTWTHPKLDTRAEHTKWLGGYYHPGDHLGCRCTSTPVYAVPELDDGVIEQRLREAGTSPRGQLAAHVAAQDTVAGRVGTSLQNEVEIRDRITRDVRRMRRRYIEGERDLA